MLAGIPFHSLIHVRFLYHYIELKQEKDIELTRPFDNGLTSPPVTNNTINWIKKERKGGYKKYG